MRSGGSTPPNIPSQRNPIDEASIRSNDCEPLPLQTDRRPPPARRRDPPRAAAPAARQLPPAEAQAAEACGEGPPPRPRPPAAEGLTMNRPLATPRPPGDPRTEAALPARLPPPSPPVLNTIGPGLALL